MKRTFPRRIGVGLAVTLPVLLAAGCGSSIWNASDLANWVREQAEKKGCERESITLDEWYTEGPDGNAWHGNCVERGSGRRMTFAINVDRVWKPSATN